jgi:hypothetical protein
MPAKPQHKTTLSILRSILESSGKEAKFAKRIGKSISWVKKASCGKIDINYDSAIKISNATGICHKWLFNNDTSKAPVGVDKLKYTGITDSNMNQKYEFCPFQEWWESKGKLIYENMSKKDLESNIYQICKIAWFTSYE